MTQNLSECTGRKIDEIRSQHEAEKTLETFVELRGPEDSRSISRKRRELLGDG